MSAPQHMPGPWAVSADADLSPIQALEEIAKEAEHYWFCSAMFQSDCPKEANKGIIHLGQEMERIKFIARRALARKGGAQ